MSWKTAYRSFYYANADEPDDIHLDPATTALLVIDVQNVYLAPKETPEETARWAPFFARMRETVIPNNARLIEECRRRGVEIVYARIACQKPDGRDRSLSQKKPGFNYLLIPKDLEEGQVVPELAPRPEDIVVTKTTDSALTGTNLRLLLRNMDIKDVICTGIFTDQCVSSTVRSLVDESFGVIVVDDCCAAATMELHHRELEIINMIYCHVVQSDELLGFFPAETAAAAE
ncbi:cysteine hydrolase family protein [Chthonobacter rhizosphaerae]|uniref:cysteine hydrolase family protein n=1 Tax=Chthonobacter rhizosphaerae TaxID=2735553 RepID=UPI0015EE6D56|nr:isochorismatase family cysteine hydrolase [Chthonobacter rhizosphaerae]